MKKILTIFLIFFGLMLSTVENARANFNDSDPVNLLQTLADRMIAGLKANQATLKANPSVVYGLAYKVVVPYADLDYMSKRVLPPQIWNRASANQRSKFESEFTKLLVRTYASALSDYSNQTVQFFPVRGGFRGKSTIMVSSQINRSDGPSVSVTYRLVAFGSTWKLYDLSVEGVSLLESFRSQFADKLSQGNMDDLIRDLQSHNKANRP